MAALDEIDLRDALPIAIALDDDAERIIRDTFRAQMWAWFRRNGDRQWKVKLWIFRPSVRVRELRALWVLLFGEDPGAA